MFSDSGSLYVVALIQKTDTFVLLNHRELVVEDNADMVKFFLKIICHFFERIFCVGANLFYESMSACFDFER